MQDQLFPDVTTDKRLAQTLMGLSQELQPDAPAVFHLVATAQAMQQLERAAYVGVRRMMFAPDAEGCLPFLYAEGLVLSDGVPFDLDDNVDWVEIANARLDDEDASESYQFESQFVNEDSSTAMLEEQEEIGQLDYEGALTQGAVLVSALRQQHLDGVLTASPAPNLKPRM